MQNHLCQTINSNLMIPLFLDKVKRLDKIQLKGVEFNIKIIIMIMVIKI